jgi:holo-[acyl-carrier protein] synthase
MRWRSPVELAVGVDVIEIDRVAQAVERWGQRFLERIYTPGELAYCRGRAERLASRFAAKEAVMKALGTGNRGVSWREVEVVRKPSGQPTILLHGRASRRAASLGIQSLAVSLSHSRSYAVASVVGSRT